MYFKIVFKLLRHSFRNCLSTLHNSIAKMSQSKSSKGSTVVNHFWKPCALLIDDEVLGGAGLGLETYLTTTIQIHRDAEATSWAGFSISFPFGKTNEDDGFGVCHSGK